MGEAKRRMLAKASVDQAAKPHPEDIAVVAKAMRHIVGAITSFHGADCLLYACVGAEVLKRRGYSAQCVAGSAIWRVGDGDGDGDVIGHSAAHAVNAFAPNHSAKFAMFHAWIEVGGDIVDFTTASLPDKASLLDASDGGHTKVLWAPSYLWTPKRSCLSLAAVAQAPSAGVFGYEQNKGLEAIVYGPELDIDVDSIADTVELAIISMEQGHEIRVIGVGDDGPQSLEDSRRSSFALGLSEQSVDSLPGPSD